MVSMRYFRGVGEFCSVKSKPRGSLTSNMGPATAATDATAEKFRKPRRVIRRTILLRRSSYRKCRLSQPSQGESGKQDPERQSASGRDRVDAKKASTLPDNNLRTRTSTQTERAADCRVCWSQPRSWSTPESYSGRQTAGG